MKRKGVFGERIESTMFELACGLNIQQLLSDISCGEQASQNIEKWKSTP